MTVLGKGHTLAGSFTSFVGNFAVSMVQQATGPALYSGGPTLLAGITNQQQWKTSYTTGTSTAGGANQAIDVIITGAASATVNYDLSATFTNILANTAATWARIKSITFKLLSGFDDSTNGTACSGLLIGNGTNPWQGFFGATTGTILLKGGNTTNPGDWVSGSTFGATGWVVNSGAKIVEVVNQDASNAFALRITAIGADA